MTLFPVDVNVSRGGVLLLLELPIVLLPAFEWKGDRWAAKKEFHLFLAGKRPKIAADQPVSEEFFVNTLRQAARGITFRIIPRKFFHLERAYEGESHSRQTIVAECDIEGRVEFFRRLSELLGMKLDPHPPHITLFTLSDKGSRQGVGVWSAENLKNFGKPLAIEELPAEIRASMKKLIA